MDGTWESCDGLVISDVNRLLSCWPYLLHAGEAACQLLPEVCHVVVVLLQVLLEVVASERQQRFLHLGVQLWTQTGCLVTCECVRSGQ